MAMDDKTLNEIVKAVTESMSSPSATKRCASYEKTNITLCAAKSVAKAVEEEAKKIGVKAVVAVSNAGGNPVLVHCTDDSFIASFDVALNKSFTSVALKMPTSTLKNLTQPNMSLYGIQFTNQGKLVIFGGGDPLITPDGEIIGGLGVSGGNEEQDTYLSDFGAKFFKENYR